jgi:hypothetical protein
VDIKLLEQLLAIALGEELTFEVSQLLSDDVFEGIDEAVS